MLNGIRTKLLTVGIGFLALLSLSIGCSDNGPEGTGTLHVSVVDAPVAGLEAMMLTVSSIRVHRDESAGESDGGWIDVTNPALSTEDRTFNLLDLVNGTAVLLGDEQLEAGHYSQIRLVVDEATITIDGNTLPLTIPSGQQSGLKLTHGFTIESGVVTSLTLDFDAEQSLHETPPGSGDWKLRPTIRIVETILSGSISGRVTPASESVVVSVYEAGTTNLVTTVHVDPVTGDYMVKGLLAGSYDLSVEAAGFTIATQNGVTVVAGAENEGHDFVLAPIAP